MSDFLRFFPATNGARMASREGGSAVNGIAEATAS
jgi:hypothetical protein